MISETRLSHKMNMFPVFLLKQYYRADFNKQLNLPKSALYSAYRIIILCEIRMCLDIMNQCMLLLLFDDIHVYHQRGTPLTMHFDIIILLVVLSGSNFI